MSTVLDDVTDETVDAAYVQRRVDDWAARVEGLYAELRGWLPDGWSASAGAPVRMHEEMMRRFDVAPREIPTLRLAGAADECAVLEPRGLWIVGANGRVDMRGGGRHYLLVDMADNFGKPVWQASSVERRRDRVALTEGWFRQALR